MHKVLAVLKGDTPMYPGSLYRVRVLDSEERRRIEDAFSRGDKKEMILTYLPLDETDPALATLVGMIEAETEISRNLGISEMGGIEKLLARLVAAGESISF